MIISQYNMLLHTFNYLKWVLAIEYKVAERGVWEVGPLLHELEVAHTLFLWGFCTALRFLHLSAADGSMYNRTAGRQFHKAYDQQNWTEPTISAASVDQVFSSPFSQPRGPLTNDLCIARPLWLWLAPSGILWPCFTQAQLRLLPCLDRIFSSDPACLEVTLEVKLRWAHCPDSRLVGMNGCTKGRTWTIVRPVPTVSSTTKACLWYRKILQVWISETGGDIQISEKCQRYPKSLHDLQTDNLSLKGSCMCMRARKTASLGRTEVPSTCKSPQNTAVIPCCCTSFPAFRRIWILRRKRWTLSVPNYHQKHKDKNLNLTWLKQHEINQKSF